MITLWMMYFIAAAAASAIFVVAGRRSRDASLANSGSRHIGLPNDPLWNEAEIDPADPTMQADAGGALRLALKRMAPVMVNKSVQADIAAPLGLWVQMRPGALTELLEELIASAIHSAPASRILLTAAPHGSSVHIAVTDDMPGSDPNVRLAAVRGLAEHVASRGGTLDVFVEPAEGTTVTLKLAALLDHPDTAHRPGAATSRSDAATPAMYSR